MIIAEDIRNSKRFPQFIQRHEAFRVTDAKFEKVFPKLGLNNFSVPLSSVRRSIPFIIKQGLFGVSAALSGSMDSHFAKRFAWRLLGTPLMYANVISDALTCGTFRKRYSDKKLEIVFSSDHTDGAWDIATMAMRGIHSCQAWGSSRERNLIGSIIDPCCGIIYVTDGQTTNHGTNMVHRSVVRYVVHKTLGPCLFMERLYTQNNPSSNWTSERDANAINFAFANELYIRTGLPIIYDFCIMEHTALPTVTFIPQGKTVGRFMYDASYRDSGIQYQPLAEADYKKFPSLNTVKSQIMS